MREESQLPEAGLSEVAKEPDAEVKVGLDTDPARQPLVVGGKLLPLPGMAAIALYMLVLAAVVTFGTLGGHFPRPFLVIAAMFVLASFGLLRMFRWAWALTLAAVFLLMSYNFWLFLEQTQAPGAIQGILNLVFFLYLVRVDVRRRLR